MHGIWAEVLIPHSTCYGRIQRVKVSCHPVFVVKMRLIAQVGTKGLDNSFQLIHVLFHINGAVPRY